MASLRAYWPDECGLLGNSLPAVVRRGIARANGHGIVSRRGLFRYLNLMFLLGHEFDGDPAISWARRILDNDAITEEDKVDALVDQALIHAGAAGV